MNDVSLKGPSISIIAKGIKPVLHHQIKWPVNMYARAYLTEAHYLEPSSDNNSNIKAPSSSMVGTTSLIRGAIDAK
jgi:hypothetical protein